MEQAVGVVRFRPAPDYDRLLAVMEEDPREVIPQAKHFMNHARTDILTQARTYNLLCYTAACVLKRSSVEAVFHGHEAVRLAREVSGLDGQTVLFDSLVNLGSAAERIGEYERAVESYREALAMPMDWLGRRLHEESVLTYLGRAFYYKGDCEDAMATFEQAVQIALANGDNAAIQTLHRLRGLCHLKLGNVDLAEYYVAMAASAANEETRYELRSRSQVLGSMAVVQLCKDDLEEAQRYAQATLELATEVQDPHGLVKAKLVLAACAKAQRRVHQVTELSAEATRVAHEYGYVPLIQEMVWLLDHIYLQRRD